ncbi:hypothetical protein KHU50_005758 [Colletotrichum sp. SAR 10_65]|nr:hypothetical protein KHU50_005758 [Colletotrichum sp. SAR 10_65]KAI8204952.1 hypothetical protein K4K52_004666 [Colletotrichum sp. SAR 10_76]
MGSSPPPPPSRGSRQSGRSSQSQSQQYSPIIPDYMDNLDGSVQAVKQRYPWLFCEASRAAVYALRDRPSVKIYWDSQKMSLRVAESRQAGESVAGSVSADDTLVKTMTQEQKLERFVLFDVECRKNHMVYHGKFFIMDAMFKAWKGVRLSGEEVVQLRTKAMAWHDDFQSKFLWQGMEPWCRSFLTSNARALTLANYFVQYSMDEDAIAPLNENDRQRRATQLERYRQEFSKHMEAQLTQPTFDSVWKNSLFADLVDYSATFSDRDGLPFYYFRLIMFTLTPLMFRHVDNKNRKRPDDNLRREIIDTYQSLAFTTLFRDVDKDIFTWKKKPTARTKSDGKVERVLSKNLWYSSAPPPPPPSHKGGARPASGASGPGSASTGFPSTGGSRRSNKRTGEGGMESPSTRTQRARRSRSSLFDSIEGDDDERARSYVGNNGGMASMLQDMDDEFDTMTMHDSFTRSFTQTLREESPSALAAERRQYH